MNCTISLKIVGNEGKTQFSPHTPEMGIKQFGSNPQKHSNPKAAKVPNNTNSKSG